MKAMSFPWLWKTAQDLDNLPLYYSTPERTGSRENIVNFGLRAKPLIAGLHVGAVGAASGLGFAAIQRAIRLQQGDTTPPDVARPMILGGLIGAALGTGAAHVINRMKGDRETKLFGKPLTPAEAADVVNVDMYGVPKYGPMVDFSKYSEKRAGILSSIGNGLRASGPWAMRAQMLGTALPSIGLSAYSASQAKDAIQKKEWKRALLASLASAGAGMWGLGGIGYQGKALGSLAKALRARSTGLPVEPEVQNSMFNNMRDYFKGVKHPESGPPKVVTPYKSSKNTLQNLIARYAPSLSEKTISGLENFGGHLEGIGHPFNENQALAIPAGMLSTMIPATAIAEKKDIGADA